MRDVLGVREFADRQQVSLSPGGGLVAFTVLSRLRADSLRAGGGTRDFAPSGAPNGTIGSRVMVVDVATRAVSAPSDDRGTSWAPSWSPDGRYLAFFSDRDDTARVWIWDRITGKSRRLSDAPVRAFRGFQPPRWSPDGTSILVKLAPDGMSAAQLAAILPARPDAPPPRRSRPADEVTASVLTSAGVESAGAPRPALTLNLDSTRSFMNVDLCDLAVVSTASGAVRRVARHVRAVGYGWSPDGRRIWMTARQPDTGRGVIVFGAFDLFVIDMIDSLGATPRLVAPRLSQDYGLRVSWSPDGKRLAWESDGALFVAGVVSGSPPRRVTAEGQRLTHEYRAPLWLDDATLLEAARDTLWRVPLDGGAMRAIALPAGQRLLEIAARADAGRVDRNGVMIAVQDRATRRSGFDRVDLGRNVVRPMWRDDVALGAPDLVYQLDAGPGARGIAFVAERADRPPEVWWMDPAGIASAVTNLNPSITRHALGRTRLIRWTRASGDTLRGALLLPAGFREGVRYPLVVKVYGGSLLSGRVNRFGLEVAPVDNVQLLATRGYAVLLPDAPLRTGTPMADLAESVLPALDTVVAMGVADPRRIGVLGHSYGGYSALALLVQSPRFRAGVASGSFSNLFTQYGELRADGSAAGVTWSETGQGRMGDTPWTNRDRYLQNSPFFFLDRVSAPVLLLHGASDPNVPVARANETFVALRRLGKTVELVRYEGEEHHPGSWTAANATDYWTRVVAWFDRYLAR